MSANPRRTDVHRSLLISVSFAKHLLGLVVLEFTLDSGRMLMPITPPVVPLKGGLP